MREYDLAPSPVRPGYIGAQKLNPYSGLSYFKRVWHNLNNSTIQTNTTDQSLFSSSIFPDYKAYGGISILEDGETNTRLVYPANIFNLTSIIRISCFGYMNNIADGYKTWTLHSAAAKETGTPSAGETIITDQSAAADDLGGSGYGAFRLDIIGNFDVSEAAGSLTSNTVATLTYNNLNSIEGQTTVVQRIEPGLNTFVPSDVTYTNLRVKNSVSNASEVVLIYGLVVEIA